MARVKKKQSTNFYDFKYQNIVTSIDIIITVYLLCITIFITDPSFTKNKVFFMIRVGFETLLILLTARLVGLVKL